MYTKKEREAYNSYRKLVCSKLGISTNNYNYLRREAQSLHHLYEEHCNGTIKEELYEKLTNDLEKAIKKYLLKLINEGIGFFYYYLQPDPRGGTLYLSKEKIDKINYCSVGLLIY
jgi:hypothetical protein